MIIKNYMYGMVFIPTSLLRNQSHRDVSPGAAFIFDATQNKKTRVPIYIIPQGRCRPKPGDPR